MKKSPKTNSSTIIGICYNLLELLNSWLPQISHGYYHILEFITIKTSEIANSNKLMFHRIILSILL